MHGALIRELSMGAGLSPHLLEGLEILNDAQRLREEYPRDWNYETGNEPHRIAFINGDVNEHGFGVALERQERTRIFKRDVGILLELFVMAGVDVIQLFCNTSVGGYLTSTSLETLRGLFNTAAMDLGKTHARSVPFVSDTWTWVLPHGRRRV